MSLNKAGSRRPDRIDVTYDYEVCAWARHFNTTQQRIKDAVKAVGDRADHVGEHLAGVAAARDAADRPSGA